MAIKEKPLRQTNHAKNSGRMRTSGLIPFPSTYVGILSLVNTSPASGSP